MAKLVTPATGGPWPGVIVLSGSIGGVPEQLAGRLASKGRAALALAYFGLPPLPPSLVEVPLEYLQRAALWLRDCEAVAGEVVGLVGASKGAELALLAAATFPDLVGPVVASAPSSVAWFGIERTGEELATGRPSSCSSWSWEGTRVPFVPWSGVEPTMTERGLRLDAVHEPGLDDAEAVRHATIAVERCRGPLLLLSGEDDHMWPSARMGDMVAGRMAAHGRGDDVEHVRYPRAGHPLLGVPRGAAATPGSLLGFDVGGDPDVDAAARDDAWHRLTSFHARAFANPPGSLKVGGIK